MSEQVIERLRKAGKRREKTQTALELADVELHAAILAAHDAGVPKRRIAIEARIVRQTVYNVLARQGRTDGE